MDTPAPGERSERMSRVRAKDTKPELAVRRLTHRLGFRYGLHVGRLPGKPDLVFPQRRLAIFVHGCFWRRHSAACPLARLPKSRLDSWILKQNRKRDLLNQRKLRDAGWRTLVIWECQLRDEKKMGSGILRFLGSSSC